jgi:hypothetical protein
VCPYLHQDLLLGWVVGEPQPEFRVHPLLVGRTGGGEGSDGVACPLDELLLEDPLGDWGSQLVRFQAVQALPHGGFGGVGVGAGVGELVAVGRPAAKKAALVFGLGGHGGLDGVLPGPAPLWLVGAVGQDSEQSCLGALHAVAVDGEGGVQEDLEQQAIEQR